MTRIFILTAMAMVLAAGMALAEPVDIGLGTMNHGEFETLKAMVSGRYKSTGSTTPRSPDIHVAEFNQHDIDAIRRAMTTPAAGVSEKSVTQDKMVDIGTGVMASSEFCDLNKLVAKNSAARDSGFTFICP